MNKSQRSVSSKDLTVDFTREEWQQLCPARRFLDRAVILENYRQLVSVGYHVSKPDVIFKLGQGEEPWIVEEFSGQNYPEAPTKRTSWYSTPQAPQWECHRQGARRLLGNGVPNLMDYRQESPANLALAAPSAHVQFFLIVRPLPRLRLRPAGNRRASGSTRCSVTESCGKEVHYSSGLTVLETFPRTGENEHISGLGVVRGYICGLRPEGVAAAGPCPEAPVWGGDAGEPQAAGVPGVLCHQT
ncbi:zinc finger protein 334 isoform X3 [Phoca vitulina]|uniref:zinc finger protein 334 isoform X3 n=1 Tax=Phoca vitulina TaxID=9720 RepID=UPI001396329C|nr:zinc finger protein 334 isoform X3 [Phoca vitulina]